MTAVPQIFMIVLCIVLCILHDTAVEGIQCYKCNYCAQPFNPKGADVSVVTCEDSCYTKTVTTGSSSLGVVSRGCGDSDGFGCSETSISNVFTGDKTVSSCYCSYSDLCNGETSRAAWLMISITVVLLCLLIQTF